MLTTATAGFMASTYNMTVKGKILNLETFSANITSINCSPTEIQIGLPRSPSWFPVAAANWVAPFFLVTSGTAFCGTSDTTARSYYLYVIAYTHALAQLVFSPRHDWIANQAYLATF